MKLWAKILIGIILGAVTGLLLGDRAEYLQPIGKLFLNLINMIIVPLIFASTAVGVTSIHDPKKLSRVGSKAVIVYLLTTCLAICIGLGLAHIFQQPRLDLPAHAVEVYTPPDFSEILLSIVPINPIAALVSGNIIQIIVFSIFLGMAINFSGEKGKPLLHFLESLADVMYCLTSLIMEFSPIGVFALMAWMTGTFGLQLVGPLLKYLAVYYLACLLQFFCVYGVIIKQLARLKFTPFLKGMRDTMMMALSTGSSAASLPVAMHCLQENLGVSRNIAGFVLPLGLTMNMNGTAIFQVMSAVFIANAYGIQLSGHAYMTLGVTAAVSALGTAGVPGGGLVMLTAVLHSVGLPLEGIAIIAAIDRLRDMASTVLNIMGDSAVTLYIAKQEGELDEHRYYHSELVELQED